MFCIPVTSAIDVAGWDETACGAKATSFSLATTVSNKIQQRSTPLLPTQGFVDALAEI
jgi:hypothetical protein